MTIQDKSIVGKKGEILPKKPLRDLAGISPGDEVLIEAFKGELIIKKNYSIEEALAMPIISSGTPESIEKDIEKEILSQENFKLGRLRKEIEKILGKWYYSSSKKFLEDARNGTLSEAEEDAIILRNLEEEIDGLEHQKTIWLN